MGLDDVVSIEVGHFSIALDPNFMPAVLGKVIKTGDVESELAALGELAHEQACREDFVLGDVGGHVGDESIDVVNAILDQSKHVFLC